MAVCLPCWSVHVIVTDLRSVRARDDGIVAYQPVRPPGSRVMTSAVALPDERPGASQVTDAELTREPCGKSPAAPVFPVLAPEQRHALVHRRQGHARPTLITHPDHVESLVGVEDPVAAGDRRRHRATRPSVGHDRDHLLRGAVEGERPEHLVVGHDAVEPHGEEPQAAPTQARPGARGGPGVLRVGREPDVDAAHGGVGDDDEVPWADPPGDPGGADELRRPHVDLSTATTARDRDAVRAAGARSGVEPHVVGHPRRLAAVGLHVGCSRNRARPREQLLFTVPAEQPRVCAVSASVRPT